ncbi:P-loop containing nucleoside triphosphate hydrolase protein [Cladochytrium replicatum]|nr:P-loop containing nucleoside triphosphate hydrolase protein [Cladochytrium replicatum]
MASRIAVLAVAAVCAVAAAYAMIKQGIVQAFTTVSLNEIMSQSGGRSIFWIGGVIWFFRYYAMMIADFIYRNITVTVTFDSQDDSFRWMVTYLLESGHVKLSTAFTASTRPQTYPGDTSWNEMRNERGSPKEETRAQKAYFLPGEGTNYFIYRNHLMWFRRQNISVSLDNMFNRGQRGSNTITIGTFGRSKDIFQTMVEEARIMSVNKDKMKTIVYVADTMNWRGEWRRSQARPTRALSTVVLEKGLAESIIHDIKEFYESETWYADRGIPYRRGYLFYGHPGTGKTSLVTALAGELQLNIYVINLSGLLSDEGLSQMMVSTSSKCILLLEDVDAALASTNRAEKTPQNGARRELQVTLSGLLNALDGAAAQEGRIVVMTTNHIEKLDPALIRPGRVDRKIFFDLATQWQARELFLQFFRGSDESHEALADTFAKAIPERKVSMAAIQGYLMMYKSSPKEAATCAGDWIAEELEKQAENEREKEQKRKEMEEKEVEGKEKQKKED